MMYGTRSFLLVSLLSVGAMCSCKKAGVDPLTNTQKMAGTHSWSGTYLYYGITYDVAYTWEVVVVDKKTVFLSDSVRRVTDTLRYVSTTDKTLLFEKRHSDAYQTTQSTLKYNYSTGALAFEFYDNDKNGVLDLNLTAH